MRTGNVDTTRTRGSHSVHIGIDTIIDTTNRDTTPWTLTTTRSAMAAIHVRTSGVRQMGTMTRWTAASGSVGRTEKRHVLSETASSSAITISFGKAQRLMNWPKCAAVRLLCSLSLFISVSLYESFGCDLTISSGELTGSLHRGSPLSTLSVHAPSTPLFQRPICLADTPSPVTDADGTKSYWTTCTDDNQCGEGLLCGDTMVYGGIAGTDKRCIYPRKPAIIDTEGWELNVE